MINIPNPRFLEFMHENYPETLQILDQPVEFLELAQKIENAGLEMVFYEKYSIWELEDYEFFVLRKKRYFSLQHLSDLRSLPEKVSNKIKKTKDRLRYS